MTYVKHHGWRGVIAREIARGPVERRELLLFVPVMGRLEGKRGSSGGARNTHALLTLVRDFEREGWVHRDGILTVVPLRPEMLQKFAAAVAESGGAPVFPKDFR